RRSKTPRAGTGAQRLRNGRRTPSPAGAALGKPDRPPASVGNPVRWRALDVARGCAIVAMVVYHFCFDLAWNGWITADFGEDWRWLGFRIPILGSFLFIAGM